MHKPLQALLVVFVIAWSGLAFADDSSQPEIENNTPTPKIDPSRLAPLFGDVQKLNDAKTKAEVEKAKAEAEAKEAKEEAKELKQKLIDAEDEKKALELLQHSGVSIGASFIVASASIKTDGDDELKQVRPGAMPYVLMLPAYWRNQPETNVYCANKYRGLEAKDVNKVTAEAAYERARIYFDYYIEPATTVEELTRSLTKTSNPTKKRKSSSEPVWDETEIKAIFADLKTYKAGLNAEPQSKEKIASEAALKRILLDVSTDVMDWQPAVATRCWRRRLGVFVGVPVLSQPFTRSVVEE